MASSKQKRTLTIALLIADTPVPQVLAKRGDYSQIYSEWLEKSQKAIARHDWQDDYEIHLLPFDVVTEQKYPDEGIMHDGLIDAVMVTGSASSAYLDLPWTNKLAQFIKHVCELHPLIRIMGICYGHQIIARALGGVVSVNEEGWELGVYECEINDEGREFLNYEEKEKFMRIHQVHRDIVSKLPPSCINLASTSRTKHQAIVKKYITPAPPLPSIAGTSAYMAFDVSDFQTDSSGPMPIRSAQVFTVQGHPEFDEDIVKTLVDARTEMGVVKGELREEGFRRSVLPHDGIHLGALFLAMLGLEPRKTDADVI